MRSLFIILLMVFLIPSISSFATYCNPNLPGGQDCQATGTNGGDCPAGYVVQNITTTGEPECVLDSGGASGFVPYINADQNVNLGIYNLTAGFLHTQRGINISSSSQLDTTDAPLIYFGNDKNSVWSGLPFRLFWDMDILNPGEFASGGLVFDDGNGYLQWIVAKFKGEINATGGNVCLTNGTGCPTNLGNSTFNQTLTDSLYAKYLFTGNNFSGSGTFTTTNNIQSKNLTTTDTTGIQIARATALSTSADLITYGNDDAFDYDGVPARFYWDGGNPFPFSFNYGITAPYFVGDGSQLLNLPNPFDQTLNIGNVVNFGAITLGSTTMNAVNLKTFTRSGLYPNDIFQLSNGTANHWIINRKGEFVSGTASKMNRPTFDNVNISSTLWHGKSLLYWDGTNYVINATSGHVYIYNNSGFGTIDYGTAVTHTTINTEEDAFNDILTGDNYLDADGNINHTKFGDCSTLVETTDYSRPVSIWVNKSLTGEEWILVEEIIYPYKTNITGQNVNCMNAKLWQSSALSFLSAKPLALANNTMALEGDTSIWNRILTQSKVINIDIDYTDKFKNKTIYSIKSKHPSYQPIFLKNGTQIGTLDMENRIVDLEGYATDEMACLIKYDKFDDYRKCMLGVLPKK